MFEDDLKKFNEIFRESEKYTKPKVKYYYDPCTDVLKKPSFTLLEQIKQYLPDRFCYMKFTDEKSFW